MASDSMADWSLVFDRISQFLEGAQRQFGIANHSFAEYAIEKLELCIHTCTTLCDHLVNFLIDLDDDEATVVQDYLSTVETLLGCVRFLHAEWLEYRDIIDASSTRFSYQSGTMRQWFGRPRFSIQQDQLEYLASLSFTWTEIASLLGVSGMTVYRYLKWIGQAL